MTAERWFKLDKTLKPHYLGGGEWFSFVSAQYAKIENGYGDEPKFLNMEQLENLKKVLNEQSNPFGN